MQRNSIVYYINVFNISGVVPKSRIYCYNNPSLRFDSHRNSEFIPEKKFALVKKKDKNGVINILFFWFSVT